MRVKISPPTSICSGLKQEDSRLRDWNCAAWRFRELPRQSWNKKILDYEIEIHYLNQVSQARRFRWNKKILDYEIEILGARHCKAWLAHVETRRFSITRLKSCVCRAWCGRVRRWNKKILDYEIEIGRGQEEIYRVDELKQEDSRLRDWNVVFGITQF